MGPNPMDYATMVEDALRGVVRKALIHVSENGLPGDNYFYITFRTDHPGVEIADYLRERYPQEMTIVLQHQFWGLDVDEEGFSVLLSFNKIHERLRIPFRALAGFSDPNSQFGLQFSVSPPDGDEGLADLDGGHPAALPAPKGARGQAGGTGRPPAAGGRASATDGTNDAGMAEDTPDAATAGGEDNVVTLDAFRKKQGQQD